MQGKTAHSREAFETVERIYGLGVGPCRASLALRAKRWAGALHRFVTGATLLVGGSGVTTGRGLGVPGRMITPGSRSVPGVDCSVGCIDWLNGR